MGVRILSGDDNQAVLYCSTSDWAFGPVFGADDDHDADERAEAFLRWFQITPDYSRFEKTQIGEHRDVRCLTESGLQHAFSTWLAQESAQYRRETSICEVCGDPVGEGNALCPACAVVI